MVYGHGDNLALATPLSLTSTIVNNTLQAQCYVVGEMRLLKAIDVAYKQHYNITQDTFLLKSLYQL